MNDTANKPQVVSRDDFNYDFHTTLDPAVAPVEYNYEARLEVPEGVEFPIEGHAVSAFLRAGDRVFQTYQSYARGGDLLIGTYNWLDLTALGRQEDWEPPPGRSDGSMQRSTGPTSRASAPASAATTTEEFE